MGQNETNKKEKTGILAYLSFAFIFLFFFWHIQRGEGTI